MSVGWAETTPAAIVMNASQPDQRTWIGTLAGLGDAPDIDEHQAPGVLVIGEVVALSAACGFAAAAELGNRVCANDGGANPVS
jgi:siroheme synthase